MTSIQTCFSKYVDFNGRARRSEFWWFYLAALVASIIGYVIAPALYYVVVLGVFLPELAAGSRRLHDTGKSGWLQLLGLIPIVGIILLIVWWAADSQPGDNQYGPNPKGVGGFGGGFGGDPAWGTPPPPPPPVG